MIYTAYTHIPLRVLVTYVPAMGSYKKEVLWHIPHDFTKEMSNMSTFVSRKTKSLNTHSHELFANATDRSFHIQVPLGIITKNENKLAEMADILRHLQVEQTKHIQCSSIMWPCI